MKANQEENGKDSPFIKREAGGLTEEELRPLVFGRPEDWEHSEAIAIDSEAMDKEAIKLRCEAEKVLCSGISIDFWDAIQYRTVMAYERKKKEMGKEKPLMPPFEAQQWFLLYKGKLGHYLPD